MRSNFAAGFIALWSTSCTVSPSDGEVGLDETSTVGDGDGDGDGDPGDGDPGDGDGDSGDGDGDSGDGDGDPTCPPGDPNVFVSYEPFVFVDGEEQVDLDWSCTAMEVDSTDGLRLVLDCPDAAMPVVIEISASPSFALPMFVGDVVALRYIYEGPWWFNIYLRIDVQGHGHMLTLIDGDSLLPPDNHPFEPPLGLEAISGLCAPEPDVCGNAERLALAFYANDGDVELLDGNYATGPAPSTDVWVDTAVHLHDISCTDTPDEWFRVLIVNAG